MPGKLLITIILFLQICLAQAQTKRQKVVSIARENHPLEWYKEQAELWKAELKKNPQNEEAWINYYTAVRGIKNMSCGTKQTVKALDSVADVVKKTIPNTFAGNFIMGYHLGFSSTETFDYNKKAYNMQPENPLTYSGLVNHYEMEMDLAERKNINQEWFYVEKYKDSSVTVEFVSSSQADKTTAVKSVNRNSRKRAPEAFLDQPLYAKLEINSDVKVTDFRKTEIHSKSLADDSLVSRFAVVL